jgi:hypothetical protein
VPQVNWFRIVGLVPLSLKISQLNSIEQSPREANNSGGKNFPPFMVPETSVSFQNSV